jgi:hypothetical protein
MLHVRIVERLRPNGMGRISPPHENASMLSRTDHEHVSLAVPRCFFRSCKPPIDIPHGVWRAFLSVHGDQAWLIRQPPSVATVMPTDDLTTARDEGKGVRRPPVDGGRNPIDRLLRAGRKGQGEEKGQAHLP